MTEERKHCETRAIAIVREGEGMNSAQLENHLALAVERERKAARISGLEFAIEEVEALRRMCQGLYAASYIGAHDDILITLRADLERGGQKSWTAIGW
jgi:hypothetical protein